jgi:hypothetical protein
MEACASLSTPGNYHRATESERPMAHKMCGELTASSTVQVHESVYQPIDLAVSFVGQEMAEEYYLGVEVTTMMTA